MDLLLTHGYFLLEDPAERRIMKPYPTLGILYISSFLKRKGFDVKVFDTTFSTKQEFFRFIERERPSLVGIYSNLMTKLNVVEEITHCKANGCRVIVGGPDVPEYAERYIDHGVDVAVIGEGEATMEELLPAMIKNKPLEGIAGIAFRNGDGSIIRTPPRPLIQDLDTLPVPDRDAIDIGRYIGTWREHHGMGSVSLICARGCPFTCTWCSRSVFGDTHRRRSVKNVVDEIEMLTLRYAPELLWFADDVFTINHKWLRQFADEIKRREIRIRFECITRADRLNEEVLRTMAEIGAYRIWFGSESGSQRILDAMQRRVSVEEIRHMTHLARQVGIQTGLFVMLGYPGEEIADIEETVEHLKIAGADTFLTTVAYPIKGTAFYKQVEERIDKPSNWAGVTDRALKFSGRYSERFYWFANRYVVNEVMHHRIRAQGRSQLLRRAGTYAKAKLSRIGMELTKEMR